MPSRIKWTPELDQTANEFVQKSTISNSVNHLLKQTDSLHKMARPRIINSPEEMLERGHAYFDECNSKGNPILVTGLALALGLSSRESLIEYGKREEFSDTVKSLKMVCENFAENKLFSSNPTGAIFALKNYGWTDRQDLNHSGELGIQTIVVAPDSKKAQKKPEVKPEF